VLTLAEQLQLFNSPETTDESQLQFRIVLFWMANCSHLVSGLGAQHVQLSGLTALVDELTHEH
jgi:hypothetical protein